MLEDETVLYRAKTQTLGMGCSSAAGSKGKGEPLTLATQNTQGLTEEKLAYLAGLGFDVLALTENHGDGPGSRMAAALGGCFVM